MTGYPDWQRPSELPVRDELLIPGIAGEDFPSTLTNAEYGSSSNRPGYRGRAVAANSRIFETVEMPRIGVLTGKTTLVLSWYVLLRADIAVGVQMGTPQADVVPLPVTTGPRARIRRAVGGNWLLETGDGVGVEGPTDLGIGFGTLNVWQLMTLRLEPDRVEALVDDTLRATHTTRFWPADSTTAHWLGIVCQAYSAAAAGDVYVGAIRGSWE